MAPCDVWISIEARSEAMQEEWEIARAIAWSNAQHAFGRTKHKNAGQFWKFPWDKKAGKADWKEIQEQHAIKVAKRELFNKQNGSS